VSLASSSVSFETEVSHPLLLIHSFCGHRAVRAVVHALRRGINVAIGGRWRRSGLRVYSLQASLGEDAVLFHQVVEGKETPSLTSDLGHGCGG
jgi:hypothetical protein